jgi:LmbE family N-acetylglucosaminyl deacetylase
MIRRIVGRLCRRAVEKRASRPDASHLARSAVVFSPHYDDETLGVGGTVIRKRDCGAIVYLVFMTDGSRSHADAMDGASLAAIRKGEALKAAAGLGVPDSHVFFLDFPEMRLAQYADEAVSRVADLLSRLRCEQVFVPSSLEPLLWSSDHNATTDIVFRALTRADERPEIFEYLVWFWYAWPWVSFQRGVDVRQLMRLTWRSRFGWSAWTRLNAAVPIADVLGQKRMALEKYQSQMMRLATDKPWPVLSDVAGGEFLGQFFQQSELFRRYRFAAIRSGDNA